MTTLVAPAPAACAPRATVPRIWTRPCRPTCGLPTRTIGFDGFGEVVGGLVAGGSLVGGVVVGGLVVGGSVVGGSLVGGLTGGGAWGRGVPALPVAFAAMPRHGLS